MRLSTISLGRLGGTEFAVHAQWIVVFLATSALLASYVLPVRYGQWSEATCWLVSMGVALAAEATLLLHELSHSFVARAHRHAVERIVFYGFAADTMLATPALAPWVDFRISIVGPLTNLALAALFWLGYRFQPQPDAPLAALLALLALCNLAAGGLNLLPLGSSDGARLLRAMRRGVGAPAPVTLPPG
jgi:Zn-dependent protease